MHTSVATNNTNCPAFPKKAQLSKLAKLTSLTRSLPEEKRPLATITRKDRPKVFGGWQWNFSALMVVVEPLLTCGGAAGNLFGWPEKRSFSAHRAAQPRDERT
jgi:hypothetical protein